MLALMVAFHRSPPEVNLHNEEHSAAARSACVLLSWKSGSGPAMNSLGMTKTQLLQAIADATDTDKRTAAFFLETITEIGYKEARKTGQFTLPGFGKLVKQKRKARLGRNPKTGAQIKIAAKTVVKFRLSKAAKDMILGSKK
jgi:DNA-binding protein HU-beta